MEEEIMNEFFDDWDKPTREVLPEKIAIMVVEFDQGIRETMVSYIREIVGYISIGAWTGEEAMMILQKGFQIDLMITDLSLPGMCGEDLTRKVAAEFKIPVILMTGDSSYSEKDAMEAGASFFMRTPIEFSRLKEIIAKFIVLDET